MHYFFEHSVPFHFCKENHNCFVLLKDLRVLQVKRHLFIPYFIILSHAAAQMWHNSSSVLQGQPLFLPLIIPSALRTPLSCYLWTHQGCCKAWSQLNLFTGSFCSKWTMKSFAEALVGRRRQRTQEDQYHLIWPACLELHYKTFCINIMRGVFKTPHESINAFDSKSRAIISYAIVESKNIGYNWMDHSASI